MFKSEDDGATWTPLNTGLYDFRISKVAINPNNPSIMFAATSGGLFRSTNGGDSWAPINFGRSLSKRNRNNALSSLALNPGNPSIIYIGTGDLRSERPIFDNSTQIYRSRDGGSSWELVYNEAGHLVYSIAANPLNPDSVYAALGHQGKGGMLLHSIDCGEANTWRVVDSSHGYSQLGFDQKNHLYATGWKPAVELTGEDDPAAARDSAALYVVQIHDADTTISRSDIVNITPRTVSGKPRSTFGLAVTAQGTVYISDRQSANPTIWRYQNGSWSAMLPYDTDQHGWADFTLYGNPRAAAYSLNVSPDGIPWHGGSMQVYRWNTNEWQQRYTQKISASSYRTRGSSNTVVFSRDMIFINKDEYYWGPADIYIEGTKNGGRDFVQIKFPDPDGKMNDVRVLTADRQNRNIWYVATHLQDQKSAHGKLLRKKLNQTWEIVFTSCCPGYPCPFAAPTVSDGGGIVDVIADGSSILVSTYFGGVYQSTNNGASWKKIESLGRNVVNKFARSGFDPKQLMAAVSGGAKGIWHSGDGGAKWRQIRASTVPHHAVAWGGAGTWYAAQAERIYRTQDNGKTWKLVYRWQKRPDIFANRYPDSNDISVGIRNPHNPAENLVSATFTVMGYFDHSSMGGLAISLDGGSAGSWRQLALKGMTYHGWGVEFNPFDPFELFYLTYGSGVYKTRLVPTAPSPAAALGSRVIQESFYAQQGWPLLGDAED